MVQLWVPIAQWLDRLTCDQKVVVLSPALELRIFLHEEYHHNNNIQAFSHFLECCLNCNAALVNEHFSEFEIFERANIYVRKITDQHTQEEVQAILEVPSILSIDVFDR